MADAVRQKNSARGGGFFSPGGGAGAESAISRDFRGGQTADIPADAPLNRSGYARNDGHGCF